MRWWFRLDWVPFRRGDRSRGLNPPPVEHVVRPPATPRPPTGQGQPSLVPGRYQFVQLLDTGEGPQRAFRFDTATGDLEVIGVTRTPVREPR